MDIGRRGGGGELYSVYMEEGKKEEDSFTEDIGRRGGGGELYSGYREKGRRRRTLQWI